MKRFKIQGMIDPDAETPLFWSNKDGWVDFHSATVFDEEEMKKIHFPMEATHIAWIDNEMGRTLERITHER